jgi:undecaprenyl-diphosphatase
LLAFEPSLVLAAASGQLKQVAQPDMLLEESGKWAYVIVSLVLLLEAVPVLGALIPAQLFLLGAGFLATAQDPRVLHLRYLLPIAIVSLIVADTISFALGARYGMALFKKLPKALADRAQAVSDGLGEHVGKTMTLGKFLGPARALAPPLAGASKVKWYRFLFWETLGSALWCTIVIGAGFLFGRSYKQVEKLLGRTSLVLLLVVVVIVIAGLRYRAVKKAEKAAAAKEQAPPPAP